jgi:8-oxo-dGTP pyrophosphatase MutT (NUDIX family)
MVSMVFKVLMPELMCPATAVRAVPAEQAAPARAPGARKTETWWPARRRTCHHGAVLNGLLTDYQASGAVEAADLARMTRLAATAPDPWSRSLPLHFTASALVVHPATGRVLLRWHVKHGLWLQVGGHADPGESDPLAIALREAREETGLTDLDPWPDGSLRHAVVCHVPASGSEPEHEHADLRYIMATASPEAIAAENEQSPLRWLTVDEARDLVGGNNLRRTLDRVDGVFAARG